MAELPGANPEWAVRLWSSGAYDGQVIGVVRDALAAGKGPGWTIQVLRSERIPIRRVPVAAIDGAARWPAGGPRVPLRRALAEGWRPWATERRGPQRATRRPQRAMRAVV